MLRSALHLHGYRIDAKDGEIGKVKDLFFDDNAFDVRYLVVDLGTWLPGRRVLLSPASLKTADWQSKVLPVDLSKEQIENSPSVESDKPVSRQLEAEVVSYFGWPMYWAPGAVPVAAVAAGARDAADVRIESSKPGPEADPHLRSMQEVAGYHVQARDGEIGHVEDFIVDDEHWAVRYLVVDTRNWLPGRKVILAPGWFERLDWKNAKVHTALSRDAIKNAPAYDPSQEVNRDYEGELHDYYGRPGYWTNMPPSMAWRV